MFFSYSRLILPLLSLTLCTLCVADDEFDILLKTTELHENESSKIEPGIDITFQYQDQNQEINEAKLTSISLTPYINIGDWNLGLDVPWQSVDGAYSYNIPLKIAQVCERVAAGLPLRTRREQARERLTLICNALADNDFENDGIGDVSVSLQYGRWLTDNAWRMGVTLNYKLDNADYETFLGSGTEDLLIDLSLIGNFNHLSTTLYAGNTFILGGELEDFYNDYSHIGATIATPWKYSWQLGAGWEYQDPNDTSLNKWKLFGGVELGEHSRISLQYVYYDSSDYVIESEATATLVFYF